MRHLFVMDPLERIQVEGDSTYVTMRECSDRGHQVWMCVPGDLFSVDGEARATSTPVRTTAEAPWFHTSAPRDKALGEFDVVWMRKDPPFDMDYIFTTYLLDMAPASTRVVNAPAGLKLFNEKLWVQQRWPEHQPATLITNDKARLGAFVRESDEQSVLKPWDGNGGRGVLVTHAADRNLSSMIELLTGEGRDFVIAQRYLPGVVKGDMRVLLFDGEPVGQMLRVPSDGDHRANMHVGATVVRCELSDTDRRVCQDLASELVAQGMLFVGIDLIDGYLTEINVTSPTGIREINRLYGRKLEADLVDRVEALCAGAQQ